MKEKIKEIDLAKAWEIAREYAKILEENKPRLYEFEDVLPYSKDEILFSLVTILKDSDFKKLAILNNTTEELMKETIAKTILFLNDFIPNPERYKEMIEIKEFWDEANQVTGGDPEKLSDDQLLELIKKLKEKDARKN